MEFFLLSFAGLGVVILALHVTLAVGAASNLMRDARAAKRATPRPVSSKLRAEVVVAVRNEAANLSPLLKSLVLQTDKDCLFLMVDDRSEDGTANLLERFADSLGPRARVIRNTRDPEDLTGKQAALDIAFTAARGDVLLFTDGDCIVPPGWVEGMLGYFSDPAVGVVLGRIELRRGASFLSRFQAFEQPLLNQYNFGSVGIGLPMGCFGNNMAVRLEAIRKAGGFRELGYSVTEDAALLSAVARRTPWGVRASTRVGTTVVTDPRPSWSEYIEQHTRWNAGAFFADDAATRAGYGFIVGYLVICCLALPLGFLDPRISLLCLNAFLSMGILGFLGGLYPGKRKGGYFLLFLPFLLFFGFFYSFISLRALARRPFEWKGSILGATRPLKRKK
jgi:cellulose synthase/poly-beta-1,6-N-acetylglucosamine synthase-like glycosyltransferase